MKKCRVEDGLRSVARPRIALQGLRVHIPAHCITLFARTTRNVIGEKLWRETVWVLRLRSAGRKSLGLAGEIAADGISMLGRTTMGPCNRGGVHQATAAIECRNGTQQQGCSQGQHGRKDFDHAWDGIASEVEGTHFHWHADDLPGSFENRDSPERSCILY